MSTASHKIETVDISGFGRGGGYENACQKMITAGMIYLSEHPDFNWKYSSLMGGAIKVYGIITPENDDSKKLDKALMKAVPDSSGAMHQAVVGHLMAIWRDGYQVWLNRARKQKSSSLEGSRVY